MPHGRDDPLFAAWWRREFPALCEQPGALAVTLRAVASRAWAASREHLPPSSIGCRDLTREELRAVFDAVLRGR